ncbi:hypothetical protein FEM48_Zijuj06G0197800 [Ziziphus jujuba var. spinosa]|uniref:HMA domain-containing protein n=1 Tax=Ziziphus jujuba var. spinosa TaxID=714518 RepID=A0A978VB96_ZIZJJ|nr:hypothetical protein FEM48_Zijuj06G0197800 [Ziziphus jujuba var. spinosa]
MKRTVVKVNINCQICKSDVLKAVTKLSGIDQVSVDAEKGLLTVLGDVDPVLIVKKVRKIGKAAEVVSVGPPKPEPKKSPKYILLPPYCNDCQFVGVGFTPYDGRLCHIL